MLKKIRTFVLMAVLVLVGLGGGYCGAEHFIPEHEPIDFLSIGVTTNTVAGYEGAALYEGDVLTYNHSLCLNKDSNTRARVTIYWRQYEPVRQLLTDPLVDNWEIVIAAGCDRKMARYQLPAFVTPGWWSLESKITVDKQTTQFSTTRFLVIAKGP